MVGVIAFLLQLSVYTLFLTSIKQKLRVFGRAEVPVIQESDIHQAEPSSETEPLIAHMALGSDVTSISRGLGQRQE
jgi:hypothetical protein